MAFPQIAVELAAAGATGRDRPICEPGSKDAHRTLCNAFFDACTAAAVDGECVPAGAGTSPGVAVSVRWRGARHAHIEVAGAQPSGTRTVRELEFARTDAVIERWRSVGYAVGVLASEINASLKAKLPDSPGDAETGEGGHRTASASSAGSATRSDSPKSSRSMRSDRKASPAAPESSERSALRRHEDLQAPNEEVAGGRRRMNVRVNHRWSAEIGAALGQGIQGRGPRLGGFVRASRAFGAPFITCALAYSVHPDDARGLAARWINASVGVGWSLLAPAWLSVHLRAEVVGEYVTVQIDEPSSNRADQHSRWLGGLLAGAELSTPPGALAVVVGLQATARTRRTDLQVSNERVGSIPQTEWLGLAGIRVEWP